MMVEIKTLKDIDQFDEINPTFISRKTLRQEAIKWIKKLEITDSCFNLLKFSGDEESIIVFINHFFNITDEDLK